MGSDAVCPTPRGQTLVALFWHSPIHLRASDRKLFARNLAPEDFEQAIGATPVPVRQDVARLLAAALLAQRGDGVIACMEGWHHNAIERRHGRALHVMTGSRLCGLFLRMLQRRGLVDGRLRLVRRDASVCTAEEAAAMWAVARERGTYTRIDGIAGFYCPSAGRAATYLRRVTAGQGSARRPYQALQSAGIRLTTAQQRLFAAARLRPHELARGVVMEAINWGVHLFSDALRPILRGERPLEVRMARHLRGPRIRDTAPAPCAR